MKKEIKLCLVYRDMWQSAGKYVPTKEQLTQVADPIIAMGCFSRIETNGGGFEQVSLLFGENPNKSVRAWTAPFNKVGIQTQMLERGLNGIRMSPVPADVRDLMFKVKKKQGTDIARSFDGLNNPQNLENSFQFARDAGMIPQGALSLTVSPLHTVEYYVDLADQFLDRGAQEICIKDMAGIGRPASVGNIIRGIRGRHPGLLIQYHAHSTPGFSVASSLEAARAGADIIDVGMEPLSWGTGHADLLTIHAMLEDAGFSLPEINMEAYMEARSFTQSFIDDFLGYYINEQNRYMSSLLIGPGLPGGMMGSLMADLEKNLLSINTWLEKNDREPLTQDKLLIKLFDEVQYVWPKVGYPPLVTPFSQYVKNLALMNVIQQIKGRPRWSMIDENTWGMILGKSGQLLGPVADEIKELAKSQDRTFYTGNPQDLYPDELELFASKMQDKGWDLGQDHEELMEYAMHPQQYEDYKSGKARKKFEEDLVARKEQATHPVRTEVSKPFEPKQMVITVDNVPYKVSIEYDADQDISSPEEQAPAGDQGSDNGQLKAIATPLEGTFYLTKDSAESGIKIGDFVKEGDTIAYVESMKVYNAITADKSGVVVEILPSTGEEVEEDEVLVKLK